MPSVAVIAGATGLVGEECLRLLLNRYDSVTSLVRKPTGRQHPKLMERRIDFDRIDTVEIPQGAHVFSALGTTIKKAGSEAAFRRVDFDYPKMLACLRRVGLNSFWCRRSVLVRLLETSICVLKASSKMLSPECRSMLLYFFAQAS